MYRKLLYAALALIVVLTAGSLGYWLLSGREATLLDCFYMTFITITTIGYGEIIDLAGKPLGRVFTMAIALTGIGIITYVLTNLTAFMVEGEIREAFRRKRMEKTVSRFSEHYIICGVSGTGSHIIRELADTGRPHVIVDNDHGVLDELARTRADAIFIEGDATDNDILRKAGIMAARGLFAVTGDDNQNLVISLSSKQLNPAARVIAACHDIKNIEKIRKAGADAVISPTFIGGLRMASEMVRPGVVSFLDTMLRDREKGLRIEEVPVPSRYVNASISSLELAGKTRCLLLAVRSQEAWVYNPPGDLRLRDGDLLIFMTSPEDRKDLERLFSAT